MINTNRQSFMPFDLVVIGYSLLMFVTILALGEPLENYYGSLLFYVSMATVAALIVRYIDPSKGRFQALIRYLYPGIMFTFFYTATGGLMFLLFDRFLDPELVAFEKAILGFNPTLYIDKNLLNVWITEIVSFTYFSYYLMIPVFLLFLFFKKRYSLIGNASTAISITFFIGYLLFFLFPLEGPRWHFAGMYVNTIDGPFFRQLVEMVIANGAVRGGCMPSTHFAVALVIMIYCFKHYRTAGWILVPINIGMAVGTVWGRFHYLSDVIVGGLIGVVVTLTVMKFYPKWLSLSQTVGQIENRESADVS